MYVIFLNTCKLLLFIPFIIKQYTLKVGSFVNIVIKEMIHTNECN